MTVKDDFEEVKLLDNFYQTSSYFPMPVVLVGTLAERGPTNHPDERPPSLLAKIEQFFGRGR